MKVVSCEVIDLLTVLSDLLKRVGDVPLGILLVSWTVPSDVEPISADLVEGIVVVAVVVVVVVVVIVVVVPFLACQMLEEY